MVGWDQVTAFDDFAGPHACGLPTMDYSNRFGRLPIAVSSKWLMCAEAAGS